MASCTRPQNPFTADPSARPARLGKAGTGASGNADNRRAASPDRKTWPAESFLLERLAQALGLVYRFYNASLIPASAGARTRNLSVQRNGPQPKTLRNCHAMTYLRKRTRSTNVRKLTLP